MRKPVAAANWKMNGDFALLEAFAKENLSKEGVQTIFALPQIFLDRAKHLGISQLAGEDVSAHASGAYTGEISAAMLKSVSCEYCIIGHSERRDMHYENEKLLIEKWHQLKACGIKPIYCLGESEKEYDAKAIDSALNRQLDPIIAAGVLDKETIIAYEPVWAIGTGKAATPEYAQSVHHKIRTKLVKNYANIADEIRILYGGSVKPDNANALISCPDIDGFLVGGASLEVVAFKKIIEAIS